MSITIDDLSQKARAMLTRALDGQDREKGLIIMQYRLGGVLHSVIIGGQQSGAYGDDVIEYQKAFYELVDHHLIIQTMIEGTPSGYMVTPLGCEVAWGNG